MQILKVKEVLLDDTHLKVVPSIVLAEMFYLHIRKKFCPKCINVPECVQAAKSWLMKEGHIERQ